MNSVLAIIYGKQHGGAIKWKKKAVLVDSICYSTFYVQSSTYFCFSNDGEGLISYGSFESNSIYIIVWNYEYKKLLTPKYVIGKFVLTFNTDPQDAQNLFLLSVYQEVHNRLWLSLFMERNPESMVILSLYSTQQNEVITCKTDIRVKTIQLKRCLFTVRGCCCILSSHSFIHCIDYQRCDLFVPTPSVLQDFMKSHMKGKLKMKSAKRHQFSFFEEEERNDWIGEEHYSDIATFTCTANCGGISYETRSTNPHLTMRHTVIDKNVLIGSIFKKQLIVYSLSCVLEVSLCHAICPLPHLSLCYSVLVSIKRHGNTLLRLVLLVVMVHLHDEHYFSNCSIYSSLQVLHYQVVKEWVGNHVTLEMKNYAMDVLTSTSQYIKRHLTGNDIGIPFVYSSESNGNCVINPKYGDILVSL